MNLRIRQNPQRYEQDAFRNLGGALVSLVELKKIDEFLSGIEECRILEVGAGTGRILKGLTRFSKSVVGVDVDVEMLKQISKAEGFEKSVDLIVADAQYLPFRKSAFGAIVCIRAIKFVDQPNRALEQMSNSIKPGGRLVLEYSNLLSPSALLQLPQIFSRNTYPRLFRRRKMERSIHDLGFRVVQVVAWHKIPVRIWVMVKQRTFARVLMETELVLQRITPLDFMSRSIVLYALRQDLPGFELKLVPMRLALGYERN